HVDRVRSDVDGGDLHARSSTGFGNGDRARSDPRTMLSIGHRGPRWNRVRRRRPRPAQVETLKITPSRYVAPPTMIPATVISSPEAHQLRSVKSDFATPTRKCAISEITAAHTSAGVPLRKK